MAEILISEIEKLDFVIFDFDGTLVRLNVDWSEIRLNLDVISIEEIWSHPGSKQLHEWKEVAEAEMEAVLRSEVVSSTVSVLSRIHFGVLTNNCEEAVISFLKRIGIRSSLVPVVGRNWLGTSKKDFQRFRAAISHILSQGLFIEDFSKDRLGYVGDSDYELNFALQLGFRTYKVEQDGAVNPYRGAGL